jgi:hypothetical protein
VCSPAELANISLDRLLEGMSAATFMSEVTKAQLPSYVQFARHIIHAPLNSWAPQVLDILLSTDRFVE